MSVASIDSADASTPVTLLTAQGTTKKVRALGLYLSTDTQCKVTVAFGAGETQIHDAHLAANGDQVIWVGYQSRTTGVVGDSYLYEGTANTAVTVTSSVAAAVAATLWYQVVT